MLDYLNRIPQNNQHQRIDLLVQCSRGILLLVLAQAQLHSGWVSSAWVGSRLSFGWVEPTQTCPRQINILAWVTSLKQSRLIRMNHLDKLLFSFGQSEKPKKYKENAFWLHGGRVMMLQRCASLRGMLRRYPKQVHQPINQIDVVVLLSQFWHILYQSSFFFRIRLICCIYCIIIVHFFPSVVQ